jgi:hypothetical protein
MWRKAKLYTLLVEVSISTVIKENSMEAPQKLTIELSYNPTIPLLHRCPKDMKSVCQETSTLLCSW